MVYDYPSTNAPLSCGTTSSTISWTQNPGIVQRFVIRKALGQWQLSDSQYGALSYFDTWDDAMEAVKKLAAQYTYYQTWYMNPCYSDGTITCY